MTEDWNTQDKDLKVADTIINKYLALNEGEPLGLLDIVVTDNTAATCELSDWLLECAEYFCQQYGQARGLYVTKKIIARCIIGDSVVH